MGKEGVVGSSPTEGLGGLPLLAGIWVRADRALRTTADSEAILWAAGRDATAQAEAWPMARDGPSCVRDVVGCT
jgi:hypothetical protein